MRVLAWRRLVTTHGDYLGLVPAGAIAGDVIAVIMGCDVPLVLHDSARTEELMLYYVVARLLVCSVHGVALKSA